MHVFEFDPMQSILWCRAAPNSSDAHWLTEEWSKLSLLQAAAGQIQTHEGVLIFPIIVCSSNMQSNITVFEDLVLVFKKKKETVGDYLTPNLWHCIFISQKINQSSSVSAQINAAWWITAPQLWLTLCAGVGMSCSWSFLHDGDIQKFLSWFF